MIRAIKDSYEVRDGVRNIDGAMVAVANSSNVYINQSFLPDKAMDLVDDTLSS